MSKTIRVLLVDDSVTFRTGLRAMLEQVPDVIVVGEAGNGEEALAQIEGLHPDVVVLDCVLPGMQGTEVAAAVRQRGLQTNVLALSAYAEEQYVRGMLEAGAVGYLLKDEPPERIVQAVRAAAEGRGWFSPAVAARIAAWTHEEREKMPSLTKRELEVLRLVAAAKTNESIAKELGITERTVRFHLRNIYDKIGVHSRTEAAVWAVRHRLAGDV